MRHIVSKYFETGAAAVLTAAVLVFGGVVFQTLHVQKGDSSAAVYSPAIILLTNEDREEGNVRELTVNPVLEEAAKRKADDMVEKGYFAHVSPEGLTPWHWFEEVGYDYVFAGENLAVNFTDSDKVHDAWMKSPYHRKNILDERFTEIGIATSKGFFNGKETIFVVEMFGSPRGAPVLSANVSDALKTRLLANPQHNLTVIYTVLGILIILALLTYIGGEWKRHHVKHALYGVIILVLLVAGLVAYRFMFPADIMII